MADKPDRAVAAAREIAAALTARKLAEVHRAAQERLGLTGAIEVLQAYEAQFNAQNTGSTAAVVVKVRSIVRALRATSRALAGRFYSLSRAIQTGFAVPDIEGERLSGQVHMSDLYREMATVLNDVLGVQPRSPAPTTLPPVSDAPTTAPNMRGEDPGPREQRVEDLVDAIMSAFQDILPEQDSEEWTRRVEIESDFEWPDAGDDEAEALLDALIEKEAKQFEAERAKLLRDKESEARRVLAKIQDAADRYAALVASHADQTVLNSARSVVENAAIKDRRTVAWMRVTGSNPCAWCAMLASRGAAYRTEQSAGGNGNLYHPNCHCQPFPVYSDHPYYSERDLYFIDNWGPVTQGRNRAESLVAWRRWLYQQKKAGLVPPQDSFANRVHTAA